MRKKNAINARPRNQAGIRKSKGNRTMTTINNLHKKWLKKPEYQRAYDEPETEFELARTLIDARLAAGLTQAQVAKRMKTSQAAISRMEGGKVKPSANSLERYAKAIGKRLRISFEPLNSV